MKLTLDTEAVLSCQACREDIALEADKIVIGARLGPYQRILIFHPDCWRITKPRWEAMLALITELPSREGHHE